MRNYNLSVAGVLAITIVSGAPACFAQADPRIDKAKEEKTVLIYGSTQLDQINAVIKRFAQRYPFITVNYSRLASERLLSRLLTEARAERNYPIS